MVTFQKIYKNCILRVFFVFLLLWGVNSHKTFGQEGVFTNIAYPVRIQNTVAKSTLDSSIITLTSAGYQLTDNANEDNIVGVADIDPAVHYETEGVEVDAYLVGSGVAYVKVSTGDGPIRKGDYITSSEEPGVGVKANIDTWVVGRALEDYDAQGVGRILVQIKPEKMALSLVNQENVRIGVKSALENTTLRIFNIANVFALKDPSRAFRYILAILIALISILFGFIMFGRIAIKGLEGMSRNPLAAKLIILSIVMNLILSIVVSGVGLSVAYLIVVY